MTMNFIVNNEHPVLSELSAGDCFKVFDEFYVKTDGGEPNEIEAMCLSRPGQMHAFSPTLMVSPRTVQVRVV